MSTRALMTVEQFAQMHPADTGEYELVEGELIPSPSGTPRHAEIRDVAGDFVRGYFRRNQAGKVYAEIDCRLGEDTVRRPDLAIFLNESLKRIDPDTIPAPIAPDIAVEVLSPSESAMEVRHKVRDYLRGGSKEVWLLDHSNVEVVLHTGSSVRILPETDVLEFPLLPGFSVRVAELVGSA